MNTDKKLNYTCIFVHGMYGWGENEGINKYIPYWGVTNGSVTEYLTSIGCESYAASVGPASSAWDRACELYAQLVGTTVDYGEAHSKAHNHDRYGRTFYQPLVKDWGELDKNGKKIILRCPIIPSVNDTKEHFEGIAKTANSLKNVLAIEIEPYHPLGTGKQEKLSSVTKQKTFKTPENTEVEGYIRSIQSLTEIPVRKA